MAVRIVGHGLHFSLVVPGVSSGWCAPGLLLLRRIMILRLLCTFTVVWGLGVVCWYRRVSRVNGCRVG
jgi:hypothetical protein